MSLHRIETAFGTNDPMLRKTLEMIAEVPTTDPVRHEMEAALHMSLARNCWATADRMRRQQREAAARERRRAERAAAKEEVEA